MHPSTIQAAEDMSLAWKVTSDHHLEPSDRLRITLRCRQEVGREGRERNLLHHDSIDASARPFDVLGVECDRIEALVPIGEPSLLSLSHR